MVAIFNPVTLAEFRDLAEGLGFSEVELSNHEIVLEREHHGDPQLVVRIYTSVSSTGATVRSKGKDAIRVVLLGRSDRVGIVGLKKTKRVNRAGTTQAIYDRIRSRAREMYTVCNQMHRGEHCSCGAPRYPGTSFCVLRDKCPEKKSS